MTQNTLTPQERFNAIIKDCLAPLMKKYHFKKKGVVFTLEDEDLIYIVKTYKSRWNTKEELAFRVEWGIDIKEEKKDPAISFYGPAIEGDLYDFTLEANLQWFHLKQGDLDPEGHDNTIKECIVSTLESKILPFLFSFHSIHDIIKILEDHLDKKSLWGSPLGGGQALYCLAAFYYFVGRPEKSLEFMDKAIQSSKFASFTIPIEEEKQKIIKIMNKEKN